MKATLEKIDLIKLHEATNEDVYLEYDNKKIKLDVIDGEAVYNDINFSKEYYIYQGDNKVPLLYTGCVRDPRFDDLFYYDGKLGFIYSKDKTIFKLWSPIASEVVLLLEDHEVKMERNNGVWIASVDGDLDGYKYKYRLKINHVFRESIDPYAISSMANGEYSYVIDPKRANVDKVKCSTEFNNFVDAIIYEINIRDFTFNDDSVKNKSKFIGLTESKDKGLKYIKELGVTHVQILPFYDFKTVDELDQFNKYNWGYDPNQYNVPEGSYSTDANDPYKRIIELKNLINSCHEYGLRVNMDVVYNHVYEHLSHPFHLVMPGYYFRYDIDGNISQGTGCGNDTESRRKMVFKYIVDSVLYWVNEYGVDGFRFDLMGIHHIDLMNEIRRQLDKIDPTIMLYGEGWNMDTKMAEEQRATILNYDKLGSIGHFNDRFRNFLRGDNFVENSKGFLLDDSFTPHMKYLLTASIIDGELDSYFSKPHHSINYVECHDDATLYDKLKSVGCTNLKDKQRLAIGLILISQGIPFLHSAMEFLRTKYGEHNTYNMGDKYNQVDWELANEHRDLIEFTKSLIKIRKEYKHFRLTSKEEITKAVNINIVSPGIIEYKITLEDELIVIINQTNDSYAMDHNGYEIIFGTLNSNNICIMKKVG